MRNRAEGEELEGRGEGLDGKRCSGADGDARMRGAGDV